MAKFQEIDIRIGLLQRLERIVSKRNSYLKLSIDFGPEIGVRTSVLKGFETLNGDLLNRQVVGIVNIVPKNIIGITSNVLLLGADSENGTLALLVPNRVSPIGSKVY